MQNQDAKSSWSLRQMSIIGRAHNYLMSDKLLLESFLSRQYLLLSLPYLSMDSDTPRSPPPFGYWLDSHRSVKFICNKILEKYIK